MGSTEAHPLEPEFITRLRTGCTSLPEAVPLRVQDTVACLERGLLRAAVVMVGLANEEEVSSLLDAALAGNKITNKPNGAARRVEVLREVIEQLTDR